MLHFIRHFEMRAQLKRYQKEERVVPLYLHMLGVAVYCRVHRVGWTMVELEFLEDPEAGMGDAIHLVDIEEIAFAVPHVVDPEVTREALADQFPDLDQLELDPNGTPDPETSNPQVVVVYMDEDVDPDDIDPGMFGPEGPWGKQG